MHLFFKLLPIIALFCSFFPAMAVKRLTYDEFIKEDVTYLGSLPEIHLILPETLKVLDHPIKIAGHLTLEQQGGTRNGISIRSDIIAHKGITLNLPTSNLTIGRADLADPIKLQAAAGQLTIKAATLDIIKAQLYSKGGMHLESPTAPINIGQAVDTQMTFPFYFRKWNDYAAPSWPITFMPYINHVPKGYSEEPTGCWKASLPGKSSNGTFLITEGSLTILSPGCTLNLSEISVLGGDFTISSKGIVDNIGGKIFVSGNGNLKDTDLHNRILTEKGFLHNLKAGLDILLLRPTTPRGEITVNGNLITNSLVNFGSFVHVGKTLVEQNPGQKKDFDYLISWEHTLRGEYIVGPQFIQPEYKSIISFGKGAVTHKAVAPKIEGIYQGPVYRMHFVGDALIGRHQNYQRPAIKSFEAKKSFVLDRASALFIPNTTPKAHFKHRPAVPLSFSLNLPPAVGLAKDRLILLTDEDRFLYHPLQEIDALPATFAAQLYRGHLDTENPNTLETYVMGRQAAYDLYCEMFAPKEIAAPDALVTLSQAIAKYDKPIKFMVPYEGLWDEGEAVYAPVSMLSSDYDNPMHRNYDGGVFADKVIMKGGDQSSLTILSTLHGDKKLQLSVPKVKVEQQAARWITYHTNTTKKKRWIGCSESTETVAVHHSVAQANTGILSTGKKGQAQLEIGTLDVTNGAKVQVGDGGLDVSIKKMIASPAVNSTLGYTETRAGRNSATRFFPVHTIQPATVTSSGGITGTIGTLELDATNLIALDKDIDLIIPGKARLGTHKERQCLGATMMKKGGTLTTTEATMDIGVPCSILALNGGVRLRIGEPLKGLPPNFTESSLMLRPQALIF